MSGSGRKSVSKWDSKEEDTGNDYTSKPGAYFRDKDPENARFYPEGNGRNGSRRSAPDDDDDGHHLKSRQQHSGEAWPTSRSRVSHDDEGGDAMMGYYDSRKSSEQDETRQPYFRHSPSRERPRTRRSGSRSNSRSRSRSRSPLQRARRDAGGSYDRHKTRARVSPRSGREVDGTRYNRAGGGDYDWEAKNRKTRDTKYYTEDSREQYPVRMSGRSEYGSGFQDDNSSRREASDPTILRSHRNDSARERRDVPEGDFHRSSNVPCRFFASGSGYCRNGNNCRFSHHGALPPARGSPERKPQNEAFSRQDSSNNNHSATTERLRNSHRWNDIERSDTGKSSEVEISRVSNSKAMPEAKRNNGSWIDDMEMSPDWNYGVKTLKKPMNDAISQSSQQSRVLKDALPPAYEHGSAAISQQDGNQRSISMFPSVGEKAVVASSHHSFSNNLAHAALPPPPPPPVQAFNQNIENHSAVPVPVPYQNTPLAVGGSQQVMLPTATNLPGGLNTSIPENGNAQNSVSREELNHISNISASLAQFFGNGQPIPIPQLHSTLNPKQAMQVPEVYGKQEQALHSQSDLLSNNSVGVPVVNASQINSSDAQVRIPDNLVSLAGIPNASVEEERVKKTEEEARKEPEGIKAGEEEEEEDIAEDAENVVEEEDDDVGAGDENNKKGGKDPKGMRAFKFALVEIVKELLKPAWKEGGMNKDAYKNIVKKVVDKVTGAIQTGNVPQTQEKIDHYLSASKPKLTKLVQAYVSKLKKS